MPKSFRFFLLALLPRSHSGSPPAATTTTTAAAAAAARLTSEAKSIKAGVVTDIGGLNDRSFNFLANKGLEDAESSSASRAACCSPSRTATTSRT